MLSLLVIGHQKKEKQERWLLSVNCGSLLYDRGLLWVQTFLLFSFFCVYQRTLELFRARAAFFFFFASIPFLLFLLVLWPCDSQMLCSKHKARWLSFLPRENSCGLWFYCRWAPLESFLFIYYSCLLSKIECSPSNLVMYKFCIQFCRENVIMLNVSARKARVWRKALRGEAEPPSGMKLLNNKHSHQNPKSVGKRKRGPAPFSSCLVLFLFFFLFQNCSVFHLAS